MLEFMGYTNAYFWLANGQLLMSFFDSQYVFDIDKMINDDSKMMK